MFDIAVIGGGPAGMMAAIHASKTHKVILLEKNDSLGKKLLLTGGGRCNVTNNIPIENLIQNIIGNGKFLYSAFSKFDNQDIIQFFQSRNTPLKEEDNGRMFPISDSSKTILSALRQELQKNNVTVFYHARVIDWKVTEHHIDSLVLEDNRVIQAKNYIIATGGMSFPHTGSNGDGYRLAQKLGHTVTDLYPSEVALTSKESFIQAQTLKGLSLQNIELKVLNAKNKTVVTQHSDIIFTHFGISGPAALRCSGFVLKQKEKEVTLSLDALPNISKAELLHIMQVEPKKTFKNILKSYLPQRYADFICMEYADTKSNQLNDKTLQNIIEHIKDFRFKVNGSLPIEKAFVTAGGISLKEINPKTMKSKIIDNLYFAGEVMDIHAYTGGYNITCAFSSGHLAGEVL